tara:strand:+ start:19 stop:255 length:237 start_codon:yes stop_codon:yes gene_type:complete
MSKNNEDRIKIVMASVFSVDVEVINKHTSPRTISSWDSLRHMSLVVALEKEFGIELEYEEIEAMVSYSIVSSTIQAYL